MGALKAENDIVEQSVSSIETENRGTRPSPHADAATGEAHDKLLVSSTDWEEVKAKGKFSARVVDHPGPTLQTQAYLSTHLTELEEREWRLCQSVGLHGSSHHKPESSNIPPLDLHRCQHLLRHLRQRPVPRRDDLAHGYPRVLKRRCNDKRWRPLQVWGRPASYSQASILVGRQGLGVPLQRAANLHLQRQRHHREEVRGAQERAHRHSPSAPFTTGIRPAERISASGDREAARQEREAERDGSAAFH